jgi:hypothetical protein
VAEPLPRHQSSNLFPTCYTLLFLSGYIANIVHTRNPPFRAKPLYARVILWDPTSPHSSSARSRQPRYDQRVAQPPHYLASSRQNRMERPNRMRIGCSDAQHPWQCRQSASGVAHLAGVSARNVPSVSTMSTSTSYRCDSAPSLFSLLIESHDIACFRAV